MYPRFLISSIDPALAAVASDTSARRAPAAMAGRRSARRRRRESGRPTMVIPPRAARLLGAVGPGMVVPRRCVHRGEEFLQRAIEELRLFEVELVPRAREHRQP